MNLGGKGQIFGQKCEFGGLNLWNFGSICADLGQKCGFCDQKREFGG